MHDDPFRGRVAVVTGGANGIGAGLVAAFAARGARVVIADLDEAAMARTAAPLRAAGSEVLCVRTDVGERASVAALADRTFATFGAAHVVCNNAGIALFGRMVDASHADWEYTMRVDFWGVVHGIEAFVPRMIAQNQGGHVVNTASMAGLTGMEWLGVYCAAKFAVVGLTESLQRELRHHGIGASVLCPMIVQTDINRNSVRMRPDHLRNPGDPTDLESIPTDVSGAMQGGVIPVDEVVRRVVRAIERNDLYILTHPEQKDFLIRRHRRIERMFDPERW